MIFRIIRYVFLCLVLLFILAMAILLSPPLFRRFVTYPTAEKEINNFQKQRKAPRSLTHLNLYRGVMHVHTFWSHDSEGTLADIIPAAEISNIDFIFLTDYPRGNLDTLPRGYNGRYGNVLVIPGSEKHGLDVWPLDSVVIDWSRNSDSIAKNIVENGGLIFSSQPEEEHNPGNRWVQGMEIYNFRTDAKDEMQLPQIANFIVNGRKYPQLSYHEMFDEQTAILSRWDSLNRERKFVGFSAVDAHENQNIRARYTNDGRIQWVGPNAKIFGTTAVRSWNRWLLHSPDKSGWIFRLMTDTYREGFNFVTNYVFANSLSISSLSEHIKKGHLFSAFKSLGDAGGFMFYVTGQNDSICCMMGDSIEFDRVSTLSAVTPLPGQFRLLHNGEIVNTSSYNSYEYNWGDMIEKGAYRIEVHIQIKGVDMPWIYSNPIYIY